MDSDSDEIHKSNKQDRNSKKCHTKIRSEESCTPQSEASCSSPDQGSSSKQAVSRCIHMLKRARNDTDKFAALLMVTKVIKAETIDDKSKSRLFDAIGVEFLLKLLRDAPSEEMCPKFMLKSIAMTIFACFINTSQKKDIFYSIVPDLLSIIGDPQLHEDNLTIIRDAYQCLLTISLSPGGRRAIIEEEGVQTLVDVYVQESFSQDLALEILKIIMNSEGQNTWMECQEHFSRLAAHACKEFSENQDERKFELCNALTEMLFSMPESLPGDDGYEWQKQLHNGLSDILLSKLGKQQRDQGLKLACAALSALGATWVIAGSSRGHQLLLIIVHLSCIEVRMSLENESFEKALELAPQTTACYTILENAIKFLVEGALDLQEKQKQQLYTALKGAFNAVVSFLKNLPEDRLRTSSMPTQLFICATIRVLGAWLAEETTAIKTEVYELLPTLIGMSRYNFEWNRDHKVENLRNKSNEIQELPDLLRFLLPGLCHLTAEDEPRQTLLNLETDKLLLDYIQAKVLQLKSYMQTKNLTSGAYSDGFDMNNLIDSIITLCSIFMNIVVTSPQDVVVKPQYFKLLKFLITVVPELPKADEKFLPLVANMCVLGLMILKHQHMCVKNTEYGIFRFIQSVVRFLWDAHNIEESRDYTSLVVSHRYRIIWDQLMELWYLGMHNLKVLISCIPWMCDFLLECDWPQSVLRALADCRPEGVEATLKCTYEDLLIAIVETSEPAKKVLVAENILSIASTHQMTGLIVALHS